MPGSMASESLPKSPSSDLPATCRGNSNVEEETSATSLAVRGTTYLLCLTVLQKVLTFVLNQLVVTKVPITVLGFCTVQLEGIILSTIVFLSKEPFRLALLRAKRPGFRLAHNEGQANSSIKMQQLVNAAWMSFPVCLVLASGMWVSFHFYVHESLEGYTAGVTLYCLSAVVEGLAEPMFVLAQSSLNFGVRATAEGAAIITRSTLIYLLAVQLRLGVLGFGLAQLANSVVILLCYLVFFLRDSSNNSQGQHPSIASSIKQLLPRLSGNTGTQEPFVEGWVFHLVQTFAVQSVFKHILTQGDSFLLFAISSVEDQGIYAIVANYGSLAARVLFQPIEETSRVLFSQSDGMGRARKLALRELLRNRLKFVSIVGLLFISFGTNYTTTLVRLLFGSKERAADIAHAFSWYCAYVFFMAWNGMCEAFVYTVAPKRYLIRLNYFLPVFFGIYALVATILVRQYQYGVAGFIIANCINMALRISYCLIFIRNFFLEDRENGFSIPEALPGPKPLCCLVSAYILTLWSSQRVTLASPLLGHLQHVSIGAALFLVFMMLLLSEEQALKKQLVALIRRRTAKEKIA